MDTIFIRELAYRLKCANAFELLTSSNWVNIARVITVFHNGEHIKLPLVPKDLNNIRFACWAPFGYVRRRLTHDIANNLRMPRSQYLKLLGLPDEPTTPPPESDTIKPSSGTVLTWTVIALCGLAIAGFYYKSDFYQPKK